MSETWTATKGDLRSRFFLVQPSPRRICEPWLSREDAMIRRTYPDYTALRQRLKTRTLSAIKQRARALGVTPRRHIWTQIEVARLKRLWTGRRPSSEELREAFPQLTPHQVTGKAAHLGLVHERPLPKVLGVAVLDAIRTRAHAEGMTMRDLDVVSGTRRYFQQTNRKIVWHHVAAGVEALGGRLVPSWDEEAEPARDALVMGYKPAALKLAA